MVAATISAASHWLVAQTPAGEKLPPPTRAAVLMALLGIALLGLLIVVGILLGGHWVRRLGSHRRGSSVPRDRLPISRYRDRPQEADPDATPISQSEYGNETKSRRSDDCGETVV